MKLRLILLACLLLTGLASAQEDAAATAEPDDAELECPDLPIGGEAGPYYVGLGDVQFNIRRYANAIDLYSCVLQVDPDYAPAYASRGYAYAALLDADNAFADYEQALALDEGLVAAYNNRGALYTTQGNFGLAINDFTLAIAFDPDAAVSYNNRGVVHAIEGNYDLALVDFEQALAIDPDYTTPHASIAAVYSALAVEQYQLYVSKAGDNARLPAGTPQTVIADLDTAVREGDFSIWLSFLNPER